MLSQPRPSRKTQMHSQRCGAPLPFSYADVFLVCLGLAQSHYSACWRTPPWPSRGPSRDAPSDMYMVWGLIAACICRIFQLRVGRAAPPPCLSSEPSEPATLNPNKPLSACASVRVRNPKLCRNPEPQTPNPKP